MGIVAFRGYDPWLLDIGPTRRDEQGCVVAVQWARPLWSQSENIFLGVAPSLVSSDQEQYRGTLLIRNRHPLGPYTRTMPRDIWWP